MSLRIYFLYAEPGLEKGWIGNEVRNSRYARLLTSAILPAL